VRRLLDGCSVLTDRNLSGAHPPVIEVLLKDGRRLEHQVSHAKGDPLNPVTDLELSAKAASLIVPVLGKARFDDIVAAISNLENVADFRTVSQLLAATKTPSATLAPETHYA
jgi:2-methylcitrate dehydratase PrpD